MFIGNCIYLHCISLRIIVPLQDYLEHMYASARLIYIYKVYLYLYISLLYQLCYIFHTLFDLCSLYIPTLIIYFVHKFETWMSVAYLIFLYVRNYIYIYMDGVVKYFEPYYISVNVANLHNDNIVINN